MFIENVHLINVVRLFSTDQPIEIHTKNQESTTYKFTSRSAVHEIHDPLDCAIKGLSILFSNSIPPF